MRSWLGTVKFLEGAKKILPLLILTAIELYLLIFVLIPYLRFDQFQHWDAAGHFFAAWFQKEHLGLALAGWNPFFSGGYAHGTFYPPLLHYVTALLSYLTGLTAAFKLVIVTSIASLPLAIYYLARKFNFEPSESAAISFLAMIPVAGLSLANGGTLYSQFVVGLNSHACAMPFYLFYFGKLREQLTKIKNHEIETIPILTQMLLTVIATIIVLTNFVVTFATIITAMVLIFHSQSKNAWLFAVKHALMVFLLTSFFMLPLMAYSQTVVTAAAVLSMGFFMTFPLLLLILTGGAVALLDQDWRFDATFYTLIAVFSITLFMDFAHVNLPMHAYRFIIFFLILAMFLPVKLIFNKVKTLSLKVAFVALFVALLAWQFTIIAFDNPRLEKNRNQLYTYQDLSQPYHDEINLNKLDGRVLLFHEKSRKTPRALEHLLPRLTGNHFLMPLFSESPNSFYIRILRKEITKLLTQKQPETNVKKFYTWLQSLKIKKITDLLQINYLLSEFPINNATLVQRVPIRRDKKDFYLYRLGKAKLASLLGYQPYHKNKGWQYYVTKWAQSPDPKILVKAKSLPKNVAAKGDKIKSIKTNTLQNRIKLKVEAKDYVPILIRVGYFPRWHAYVNGKQTKIYQVAPSFMLIYGKGDILLEYKDTLLDRVAKLLSSLGVIWLFAELSAFYFKQRKQYQQ